MTAGDGKVAVPGKSPAVMPSLWSKDGTDGLGAVPSVLGKSWTAHRPRPSDGTVDITACGPISYEESNTQDEAAEHNEEEMRAEEQEDTLDLWWSKRSAGRTGGLKGGPSGIIPHNMDLF